MSTINLIPDATTQKLPDGSSIDGQTTFTKTDGTTGTAAAVTFAYDAQDHAIKYGGNDNLWFFAEAEH